MKVYVPRTCFCW